ncbi:UNVERIFIED_CONTAM: hypothetical protein Sradi_3770400 [Sesamum radiatum]|uniref:Uncharacterized protein n=1 Tax=Sesamum radiatum TaxID=300843 RepID=A0AAW2PZF0_SESRA
MGDGDRRRCWATAAVVALAAMGDAVGQRGDDVTVARRRPLCWGSGEGGGWLGKRAGGGRAWRRSRGGVGEWEGWRPSPSQRWATRSPSKSGRPRQRCPSSPPLLGQRGGVRWKRAGRAGGKEEQGWWVLE